MSPRLQANLSKKKWIRILVNRRCSDPITQETLRNDKLKKQITFPNILGALEDAANRHHQEALQESRVHLKMRFVSVVHHLGVLPELRYVMESEQSFLE